MVVSPTASAPNISARCEMDLSPGRRALPESAVPGLAVLGFTRIWLSLSGEAFVDGCYAAFAAAGKVLSGLAGGLQSPVVARRRPPVPGPASPAPPEPARAAAHSLLTAIHAHGH